MIYRPMHLLGHLNRIDKSNSALHAGFPTSRILDVIETLVCFDILYLFHNLLLLYFPVVNSSIKIFNDVLITILLSESRSKMSSGSGNTNIKIPSHNI